MFSEKKVAQMSAYFLAKLGGRVAYIKLIKLLYLAERQAMAKWGDSISGDLFVSMPHGPVLSRTYDLIKGLGGSAWNDLIKDETNYEVSLRGSISEDDLDQLSRADIRILDSTFEEYGKLDPFELVDYTHNNCKEWQDPNGSSFPIKPEDIFRALGKDEDQVQKLLAKRQEQRSLDSIKASLI